jgi:hypothetical protein
MSYGASLSRTAAPICACDDTAKASSIARSVPADIGAAGRQTNSPRSACRRKCRKKLGVISR